VFFRYIIAWLISFLLALFHLVSAGPEAPTPTSSTPPSATPSTTPNPTPDATPLPTPGATPSPTPSTPAPVTGTAVINGSFIQPYLVDSLTDQQLASNDAYLTRAGLTQQVLQWTADSRTKTTVFPSGIAGYAQSSGTDLLARTLYAADQAGLTEYVGLQLSEDWWTKSSDQTWLTGEAAFANQLADRIWEWYGAHASFGGWYLPFEVDNWNFTTTASWARLAGFYTTVAGHLHALTPGLPVIISPFFNPSGGLTSAQWTGMWTYILKNSPVDVIALQDGFGAGHVATAQLAEWFSATAAAISAAGVTTRLWCDIETYTLPANPLAIGTVVANMNQVSPYVSNFLSFSYDHYDSPEQVGDLYDKTYRDYRSTGSVEATPPSAPPSLVAGVVDASSARLIWTASTDNVGVAGYQVLRNGALVGTIYSTTTSFTDTSLPSGTSHSYTVAAFDAAGNVSANSRTVSVTTPAAQDSPVNYALGASYFSSLAASPTYPDSGSELTNGAYGTPAYWNPAWQGQATPNPYSFTVDLGATKTVNEVDSDWLQFRSAYVFLPSQLVVETSTDGDTFTTAGTITAPSVSAADQSVRYRLTGLSVNARYVRVTVTPASYAWSFTDELEVRGN